MSNTPRYSKVTLRDIAEKCGYSHSTVSRALRSDPRLKPETIENIQQIAKEMGYLPNPMIVSFMSAMNRHRKADTLNANIGWLNTHPNKNHWHDHPYFARYVEAARERAYERGYGFEELWTVEPGLTPKRLDQIAQSRFIQGFIVPGNITALAEAKFNWNDYAVVCLRDRAPAQLNWNRVSISQRENVQFTYRRLRELGYRKIAYSAVIYLPDESMVKQMEAFNRGEMPDDSFLLLDSVRLQLAGFNYTQLFAESYNRIWPLLYNDRHAPGTKNLTDWLKRVRPEAVITNDNVMVEMCEKVGLKVGKDIAVAHLNHDEDVADWAGINPLPEQQSSAAVDLLCAQIQSNERGEPPFSKDMQIAGAWVDGWTAPALNQ